MDSKIIVSESVCHDEVVGYMASRYSIAPELVIRKFFCQDGIIKHSLPDDSSGVSFEENEMAILRDMGIRPTCVEFEKQVIDKI